MSGRLDGSAIVVTGGAAGLGLAYARRFLREGACVFLADIVDPADAVASLDAGDRAAGGRVDVASAASVDAMVAAAERRLGRIDVLVNNAAVFATLTPRPFEAIPEEEWDRVMAVDLKSMLLATQAAVPDMERRGAGSIICISSVAGLRGYGRTAYAAAKAGVIGFVKSVAVQLGPRGIRVNAIAPGTVWTPMVEDLGEQARERRRRATPLGTEGTAWDIGWGALYLASDEARWVTGQVLVIDAGLTATASAGGSGPHPDRTGS